MEIKNGEHITIIDNMVMAIEWYTDGKLDCSLSTENGTHNFTHGNTDQTWQSYTIKDNQFDGTWVIFHSNGVMSDYRNYKDGKRHGQWKSWHADGTQWNEENYVDGKKHGKFLTWRSGEVKEYEGQYEDGLKTGLWKYYFDDGLKLKQGKYIKGEKEGEWLLFFEKSEEEIIHEVYTYENGVVNGQYTKYYRNRSVEKQGNLQDNKKEGMWNFY